LLLCSFKNTPFSRGNVRIMGLSDDMNADTDRKKKAPFFALNPTERP
jgi:hypothetical protein